MDDMGQRTPWLCNDVEKWDSRNKAAKDMVG
jgi:hypothetical protein